MASKGEYEMNNNRCVQCNDIIPEGIDVCPNCLVNPYRISEKQVSLSDLKKELWHLVRSEGIEITNQNIDWLLERAYKGVKK